MKKPVLCQVLSLLGNNWFVINLAVIKMINKKYNTVKVTIITGQFSNSALTDIKL